VPVFGRAGGIVPLGPRVGWGGVENPAELHLHLFTGADGHFTLFEDDGVTTAYRDGAFATTRFEQKWEKHRIWVTIAPPAGDLSVIPDRRRYFLHVYGVAAPGQVTVMIDGVAHPLPAVHDPVTEIAVAGPLDVDVTTLAYVTIAAQADGALLSRRDRLKEKVIQMLWAFRMDTLAKNWIADRLDELAEAPERLADFGYDLAPAQIRALLEITQDAGVHYVADTVDPHLIILWNNREAPGFRHHFAQLRADRWHAHERYGSSWGATPRFRAIRPEGERWRLTVDYFGLYTHSIAGR
jgi:hypothetical protein